MFHWWFGFLAGNVSGMTSAVKQTFKLLLEVCNVSSYVQIFGPFNCSDSSEGRGLKGNVIAA